MLLPQHGILGGIFTTAAPVLVSSAHTNPGTTATYAVTPSVTPTTGNLMVIVFGGAQTRTVSSAPSGWSNQITSGAVGPCHEVYTKTASSESGGAYSFTLSGTLQGAISFFEISGITSGKLFQDFQYPAVSQGTYTYSSYNVNYPAIVIVGLAGGAFVSATINNSFTLDNGLSQRFHAGHRIYSIAATSESTTWTLNTAQIASISIIAFR